MGGFNPTLPFVELKCVDSMREVKIKKIRDSYIVHVMYKIKIAEALEGNF